MKYLLLLIILGVSTGFYIRNQQPELWNRLTPYLKAELPSMTRVPAGSITKSFIPPNPLPSRPNWAWTTNHGKTYSKVVIVKVEPDCVSILDSDGGARIAISDLPPEIQQQLNYDPDLAAKASEERKGNEQASAASLAQERAEANQIQQNKLAQLGLQKDALTTDNSTGTGGSPATSSDSSSSYSSGSYEGNSWEYYETDYYEVRRHVTINPQTGIAEGDAEWLRRYERDRHAMAERDRIRTENVSGIQQKSRTLNSSNTVAIQNHSTDAARTESPSRPSPSSLRSAPSIIPSPVPNLTPPPSH